MGYKVMILLLTILVNCKKFCSLNIIENLYIDDLMLSIN